jgi:hypothetical protein
MRIRELVSELPQPATPAVRAEPSDPGRPVSDIYDIMPDDHRQP